MHDQRTGGPPDASERPANQHGRNRRERMKSQADDVVVTSDDSFPASDPPSWTPVGGVGSGPDRKHKKSN